MHLTIKHAALSMHEGCWFSSASSQLTRDAARLGRDDAGLKRAAARLRIEAAL